MAWIWLEPDSKQAPHHKIILNGSIQCKHVYSDIKDQVDISLLTNGLRSETNLSKIMEYVDET